jgi:nicotinamidase-related amidase
MTKALFIVDMQKSFIKEHGELPVPYAMNIIQDVLNIIHICVDYQIPILMSKDRHFITDREITEIIKKLHCMNKTEGQKLIDSLAVNLKVIDIPNKVSAYGDFEQIPYGTIIEYIKSMSSNTALAFEKQTTDVFTNPHIRFVLEKMNITEVYIVGVATEFCVKDAVIGFLKEGIKVKVVKDAIKGIDESESNIALKIMCAEGADLITVKQALKELSG